MKISPKPLNELERLEALKQLQILDSDPERDFDDIVKLASLISESSMSLIGLIDETRQWYKAKVGVTGNEVQRELTFCSHALHDDRILLVPDATKDDRFFNNPFVQNDPWIRFYAGVPLRTIQGYALGTLCVFDTQPKQLNEKQLLSLRVLANQVMKLFELRSKMFEIEEARKKAEQATRSKSLFLSMISHEIRTPMNGVVGLTNLLLQDSPKESQVESLKLIKFAGENLVTIINDILDFSKIEANKLSIENTSLDFRELINNITNLLKPRAAEKGISLIVNIDVTNPRFIVTDKVRLTQIITNLVGNAIKFTDQGHVQLSVMHMGAKEGKHTICFSIKDTGIGIAGDKIEKIFETFSQAEDDTTRKYGGTGLGLSITKSILHLMGSSIEVESTPGKGSTFQFTLALEEGKYEDKKEERPSQQLNTNQKVKVLVVDDNPLNQVVAGNFLKKWNINYDVANNGLEALAKVKEESFNLIFMDLQMPGMDGYETAEKVRHISKDIPIIALTASALEEVSDKALQSGMTGCITKPFRPEELQAMLNSYLLKSK